MSAVAVFTGIGGVKGEVVFHQTRTGCSVRAHFLELPAGEHGFHIHRAGDLRGEGCKGACEHYHKGSPQPHGGAPSQTKVRHTGDLGNISNAPCIKQYFLKSVTVQDLYGRSLIVHEDPDDLGKGSHDDSSITGHSGKRIACAIIGRAKQCSTTRKIRRI